MASKPTASLYFGFSLGKVVLGLSLPSIICIYLWCGCEGSYYSCLLHFPRHECKSRQRLNSRHHFGALNSFSTKLQEDGGKRVLGYWLAFGALVTGGAAAFELVIRQADVLPPGEATFMAHFLISPFGPARLAVALVPLVPRVTRKKILEDDVPGARVPGQPGCFCTCLPFLDIGNFG